MVTLSAIGPKSQACISGRDKLRPQAAANILFSGIYQLSEPTSKAYKEAWDKASKDPVKVNLFNIWGHIKRFKTRDNRLLARRKAVITQLADFMQREFESRFPEFDSNRPDLLKLSPEQVTPADAFRHDVALVRTGQLVDFTLPYDPDKIHDGKNTTNTYVLTDTTRDMEGNVDNIEDPRNDAIQFDRYEELLSEFGHSPHNSSFFYNLVKDASRWANFRTYYLNFLGQRVDAGQTPLTLHDKNHPAFHMDDSIGS